MLGGQVKSITPPYQHVVGNFAVAILDFDAGAVAVVLNAHFPVIAFADPPKEGEISLRFVDSPKLADTFRSFGVYTVVDRTVLLESVNASHWKQLASAEMERLRYFKPRCVGEVIFNCWD